LLHNDNSKTIKYSYEDILDKIKDFSSKNVILTGGEPSIYNLNSFIDFLQAHGYYVCIETNGFNFSNIKNANWITYSPKDWNNISSTYGDEYKFIIDKNCDISAILALKTSKPIYLQPQNNIHTPNMQNVDNCVNLVKKYPQFKLSLQTHKFIGVL